MRALPLPTAAAALAACLLLAGCLAPRPEDEVSLEEFAAKLSEGAAPVQGTSEEGATADLSADPELSTDPALLAQLAADQAQAEEDEDEPYVEENPFLRFGERILVREFDDGLRFVVKPFPMPTKRAKRIVELMDALEPFPFRQRPKPNAETGEGPPLDEEVVQYQILENWDEEFYNNLTAAVPGAPQAVPVSDLLVITAVPDLLAEFEAFIDTFAAGVPQIELEAKIIEIVETDTTDIGIRSPEGVPIFAFEDPAFVSAFDFNLSNVAGATEALLTLGGIHDGTTFNAILEAVKEWQNVTIESRPTTVVRAGAVAQLLSTRSIPFFDVKSITPNGGFNAGTTYKEVGVKLYIVPRVVGSTKLALDVHLEGSQVVGFQRTVTQSSDSGSVVSGIDVPILSQRTAKTVVYLEPGQTLVIGGLTRESTTDTIRKVPILGDIPLLGLLFRSTFKEVEREHVLFAISPRVVQESEFEPAF